MAEKLLPTKRAEKQSMSVHVDSELLEQVRTEAKIRGITLRSIVEYGLRQFLEASAAEKAKKST
jgi:hypothetical protein